MTGIPAELSELEDAIERSAAPSAARRGLERLEAAHAGLSTMLQDDEPLCRTVVAVLAASRSLTLLLETDADAIAVLRDLGTRPGMPGESALEEDTLRRWKAHEYLRIAGRDLTGLDDLRHTTAALAALARDVLVAAATLAAGDAPEDLVVVGMGKLGGTELNYASDIDVMFVGGDGTGPGRIEAQARELMRVARRCFRVDANLRPEGRDGPLVRTVSSYRAYWERWARPWEFQALLKARPVTGSPELAATFTAATEAALWDRPWDADDLRSLRTMKVRAEEEVARKGLEGRELKRGSGGIRDIEFSVQLLQLVHGRHDPALRSPTTQDALAELGSAGYIAAGDAATLDGAYRFLRTVEHRLQLAEERQVHVVPAEKTDRELLARVLGFRGTADATALAGFDRELARRRASVRAIHQRLYFRPLLEAFAGAEGGLSPEAAETRLAAFGFRDAERTRQAVRELTRGLTRSSRMMHQLLPLLFGWLSDSPDPDRGLLGLRTLASGSQRSSELARAFRESAETARRLCTVLGTSRLLGEILHHNPDLISAIGDDDALTVPSASELLEQAGSTLAWRDADTRVAGLKRFKERQLLKIGVRDVIGRSDVEATAAALTGLAEATLHAAVTALEPELPFAVVAMGRFGGAELSYASDLDVVFVYEGDGPADFAEAERLAATLLRDLKGATPTARIYLLDADLRPEGRQGSLARSLDGFRAYFERWAQVWERQAMLRARPVAGDADLGRRFVDALAPFVWERPVGAEDVREIRRSKARVERERIPAGEDPQFHLKLGRGSLSDVEFCAQLLQLEHRVPSPGTMQALSRLVEAGALDGEDGAVLAEAYRFCELTRNRLYLLGAGGDALPQAPEDLARLARSLDTTPVELREQYRRVTRRSRAVVERVFYGRS
ncbi:MAG TPA: bifunctional [glutamine synthetase] adenylyltransferase/[glutamine synthetase]-adenylyl-L-tyrosine phosphorylase [Acidimicrobiales bacterium]|nr:bifunctional [glutamine synthetase] adenylyltransferase/[glutamine synthetase]-adenylyl-L-tyrosine phosphorylase [Acidimicrobiales bacterium]